VEICASGGDDTRHSLSSAAVVIDYCYFFRKMAKDQKWVFIEITQQIFNSLPKLSYKILVNKHSHKMHNLLIKKIQDGKY
jgi:hypothetical protein